MLAIPLALICVFFSIALEVSLLMFHNDIISFNGGLILFLLKYSCLYLAFRMSQQGNRVGSNVDTGVK